MKVKGVAKDDLAKLSSREIEILTWTARGKTLMETAIILSIKPDTVQDSLERTARKLNTVNKTHTVAVAIAQGIIKIN